MADNSGISTGKATDVAHNVCATLGHSLAHYPIEQLLTPQTNFITIKYELRCQRCTLTAQAIEGLRIRPAQKADKAAAGAQ